MPSTGIFNFMSGFTGKGLMIGVVGIIAFIIFAAVLGIFIWLIIKKKKYNIKVLLWSGLSGEEEVKPNLFKSYDAKLLKKKGVVEGLRILKPKMIVNPPKFSQIAPYGKKYILQGVRIGTNQIKWLDLPNAQKGLNITDIDKSGLSVWLLNYEEKIRSITEPTKSIFMQLLPYLAPVVMGVIFIVFIVLFFRFAGDWVGMLSGLSEQVQATHTTLLEIAKLLKGVPTY